MPSSRHAPPSVSEPECTLVAAEPLLAGTLELLTFYARHPSLAGADQIASQFARLARHPGMSDAMQGVCTRLFLEWLGPPDTQDTGPEQQWKDVHAKPTMTQ